MLGKTNNGALSARMAGVKVARDVTTTERSDPQKLQGFVEAKVLFVGYTDHRGESQSIMLFEVNGEYWTTKDSTEWCSQLRRPADWLLEQLAAAKKSREEDTKPIDVPKTDNVEIMDFNNDG